MRVGNHPILIFCKNVGNNVDFFGFFFEELKKHVTFAPKCITLHKGILNAQW